MREHTPPPVKPARMSQRRYRQLYDSTPTTVEVPGRRYRCAGPVSAEVVAKTLRAAGLRVRIYPTD